MAAEKSLKDFLFRCANILTGLFLLGAFFIAGQTVVETYRVADMTALNNLQPQPLDYFLELYLRQGEPDKNKIHCYMDYYQHLLQVFPDLWDAYGMLGYCYHYLKDDAKAIQSLKTAIDHSPDNFWNYYNLAAVYINAARYKEASELLQRAVKVPPMAGLKMLFSSSLVYLPLMEPDQKKAFAFSAGHLKDMYRSSFMLLEVLSRVDTNKRVRYLVQKMQPELYAF